MKVLMLSWEFSPQLVGGLGKHVVELVPELIARGVEVHLVVPKLNGGASNEPLLLPDGSPAQNGSQVYRVDTGNQWGDYFTNTWHDNVQIEGFCTDLVSREGGFDLVHNHDWLSGFAAVALKKAFHLPLLSTIHATEMGRNHGNLWSEMQRAIHTAEWLVTYESWRVIACSHYMAWEINSTLGVPRDKIDVIPNGVDPRSFDSLHDLDLSSFRLGFADPHQKIAYYVGRIVPEKGLQVLLDAVPLILREMPDLRFVLAGSGVYAVELRAKAYELSIADNIIFTGRVSDDVRDALFKVADCAVFPSLYEPFGIVALEAMAAGTPVVVSDVGGLSEVVSLHETGIKVHPGDPESLAWGILHTLRHPDWSRERAAKASQLVRSEYNWPHIAELTEEVYERMVDEARAGHWAYRI